MPVRICQMLRYKSAWYTLRRKTYFWEYFFKISTRGYPLNILSNVQRPIILITDHKVINISVINPYQSVKIKNPKCPVQYIQVHLRVLPALTSDKLLNTINSSTALKAIVAAHPSLQFTVGPQPDNSSEFWQHSRQCNSSEYSIFLVWLNIPTCQLHSRKSTSFS